MTRAAGASPDAVAASRFALALAAAVWLVYIATFGGTLSTEDAVAVYEQGKAILDRRALDVPPAYSNEYWRGVDGLSYTPFGIGQALFDVPFIWLGRVASQAVRLAAADADTLPKAFVAAASTVPAAIAVGFAFLLALRLSGHVASSLAAAIALAFGTLLWPYSKFGFNAALAAGTLTAGVYWIAAGCLDDRPRALLFGGACLGFALLVRHEMTIAAVACVAWMGVQTMRQHRRLDHLLLGAAGIAVALLISLWLNQHRFGTPWFTGHTPTFSGAGVRAFVASPSGALWLYAPPAAAALALIPRALRGEPLPVLLALVSGAMLAFYAALDDWLGTRSYGPRYLVPLLPLLTAPLAMALARAPAGRRRVIYALVAASIVLQMPAVLTDPARAGIAAHQPSQTVRRDDWRWTPLFVSARQAVRSLPANVRYLTGRVRPPAIPAASAGGSLGDRLSFSLDFWWLYLVYLRALPIAAAALVAGTLLTGALAILWRLSIRARMADGRTPA